MVGSNLITISPINIFKLLLQLVIASLTLVLACYKASNRELPEKNKENRILKWVLKYRETTFTL